MRGEQGGTAFHQTAAGAGQNDDNRTATASGRGKQCADNAGLRDVPAFDAGCQEPLRQRRGRLRSTFTEGMEVAGDGKNAFRDPWCICWPSHRPHRGH